MTDSFTHFVGIDWSGARGKRLRGLAVAVAVPGVSEPELVTPESLGIARGRTWSRPMLIDWIKESFLTDDNKRALIGFDAAFSLPYLDAGAYLPGSEEAQWRSAPELWSAVEAACQGEDSFYAKGFVDVHADYFLRPNARGERFQARFRLSELRANTGPYAVGRMESPFHLVGPSQVGMSGLSTMRMLAHLSSEPGVAFWPFMPITDARAVFVEIFCTYFARLAGHVGKIRDAERLNLCLAELDSNPVMLTGPVSDHDADALLSAAGLRMLAGQGCYWNPQALSDKVRRSEGWVFGIV